MKKKAHLCFSNMLAFLLVLFTLLQVKVVVAQGTTTDVTVMNDLKKGLNLPSQLDWSDPDPCKWPSITCTNQRVSRIQIKVGAAGGGVVTGTLPDSLNSLSALEHLELRGTQLSGPLPTLNGLSSLRELLISQNQFTSIPVDFFQGLTTLAVVAMDYIPFQPWQIPASLQTCSSLSNFSANYANVSGNIPGLFNGDSFPNLVELHLAGNQLQGGLPLNFSSLSSLVSLWLNGQNLSGTIDVVGKMTSLKEIWFNKNVFTGPLPDLSGLLALSDFNIRDNQFTGPVPESLTSLKSLTVVNLTNNNLQGPMPVFDKSVQVDMTANTNSFCLDTVGACAPAVNTFLAIAKNLGYPYRFAENWKGNDPCTWPGISCPNGNITVINFQKMGLTGTISPNFSSIVSVQVIDLSDNNLYGTIPIELTTLPALTKLDLSNNKLTGKVPSFRNGIINTDGNPEIGVEKETPPSPGSPPRGPGNTPPSDSPGKKKSSVNVGVVVGAVIGGAFFVLLVVGVGCCLYRKKHKSGRVQSPNTMVVHPHNSGSDPDMVKITIAGSNVNVGTASETHSHASGGPSDVQMVEAGNMVITIQVLRTVTNNFSEDNVLGRGGFGTVYKGQLHDGSTIAVKRMESGVMGEKGLTEFKSEIAILNKVRHRHLVSLSGYCLDGNERILVYEYMPQGTLSDHLFSWKEKFLKPLEWTRRLSIALDVARGVEYLHGLTSQSFIHRDLKPSNILLGDDMRAKVADFGLIRLAPEGKASIETRLAGTFGYLAPEYAATGRVTTKVDVYAFGVILMELITGRKALDESQPEESVHLVSWFRRMNLNKDTFRKAIDPTMDIDEAALTSISTVSELAGYCCSREPYQRPDMGHVVNVLSSFVELWKPSNTDPEDIYSIDMDLSLAQTLKKWQAFDGESSMDRDTNSFLGSVDNTQTSIPLRPSGFADSFTSADGR